MATTDEPTTDQPTTRDVAGGVRELLRGTGSAEDNKWRRGLHQGRESNVLFAVALRAAGRSAAARTPLERDLLDIVGTILTDDELVAAGAEYASAVADLAGAVPLLPTAVTAMPPDRGFGIDDLVKHLPDMRAENAGRANCAVVDVAAVVAGTPIHGPAYLAAVDATGFGATLVSGPPPAPEADPEDYLYYGTFQFDEFTCRREVGDGLSGRDEIYWTAAVRSDLVTGRTYQSREFGAVKKGHVRKFEGDDRAVFDGLADDFIVAAVQVWEADHSNSAWYDALHHGLGMWLTRPAWADLAMAIADGPPGLDVVEAFGRLFIALKEALRNKDDLSCYQTYVFDRAALRAMERQGSATWDFNGDGHHTLRVAYSSRPPAHTTGILEMCTHSGPDETTMSTPVPLGWKAATPPAVAVFEDELHCVYARPGDFAVLWSRRDTKGRWSRPAQVGTFASLSPPALTVWRNALWMAAARPGDNKIELASWTAGGWTHRETRPRATTRAPSLAVRPDADDGDSLFLLLSTEWSRLGLDEHVGYQSVSPWYVRIGGQFVGLPTHHAPSLTIANGGLLAAIVDPGGDVVLLRNGTNDPRPLETEDRRYPVAGGLDSVALVADPHSAVAWLAARYPSGTILFDLRSSRGVWDGAGTLEAGAMNGKLALALHPDSGMLYVMYRRP